MAEERKSRADMVYDNLRKALKGSNCSIHYEGGCIHVDKTTTNSNPNYSTDFNVERVIFSKSDFEKLVEGLANSPRSSMSVSGAYGFMNKKSKSRDENLDTTNGYGKVVSIDLLLTVDQEKRPVLSLNYAPHGSMIVG